MMNKIPFALSLFLGTSAVLNAADYTIHSFKKLVLSDQFYCEGVYFGDFNKDGKMDVVAGSLWYEGPDFKVKHEFRPGKTYNPKEYSDNFITFAYDFNGDGWMDILIIDTPGQTGTWYENPKNQGGHWPKHLGFPVVDNESPDFGDLNDDGKPEMIFNYDGYLGYATPNWADPNQPWKFHRITPKGKYHKYTHGLGYGDINGDGRTDYIEVAGWWEQPSSLADDPVWKFHPANFGDGGAQMLVYDVNGDGYNDIVTCLNPHQYGLAWFEQVREQGREISWIKHPIMGTKPQDNDYGVKFTQIHAFSKVDMNGDGVLDFVTGKRFWAHPPPTDPESDAPAVLYWFETCRDAATKTAKFIPHLIDDNSGVGTQVVTTDMNGDGLPDVLVGNKKGVFVFLHQAQKATQAEWEAAQPKLIK